MLALPLDEASAKISAGGPDDGESEDAELPVWAGHVPLRLVAGEPVPCPHLRPGHPGAAGDRRLLALTRHHGGDEDRHPLRQERRPDPRQRRQPVADDAHVGEPSARRPRRIASPPPAACRLRTHCARDP